MPVDETGPYGSDVFDHFLVIYPFSIGPAFLLDFKLRKKVQDGSLKGPSQTFTICYYPILWLAFNHSSAGTALDWYLKLWFPPSERG